MKTQSPPAPAQAAAARTTPDAFESLWALTGYFLRKTSRSVVIWGLSFSAMSVLVVVIYPSVNNSINDLIASYPPQLKALFGLQGQVTSIQSWLAVEVFNFMAPLTLAFYPILMGARAIAGAEEKGTLDVLLSNPAPRRQLVLSTFIAMALGLLSILGILGLLTWVAALLANVDLPVSSAVAAVLNLWPLCMFFGSLALLCSAVVRRAALAIAIPGALLITMYFLNALGGLADPLGSMRPLTLFYHYGSAVERGIHWSSFSAITLLSLLLVFLAVLAFDRRDVYA